LMVVMTATNLSLFLNLSVCRGSSLLPGEKERWEKPKHATAREPGPPQVSQYSLHIDNPLLHT
jgi:hypothetical protein